MIRRLTSAPKPASRREAHDLLDRAGAVVADAQAVAHAVELGQVARGLARQDQVVGGERVLEARAGDLDDLGAEPARGCSTASANRWRTPAW